jgi:hypothetical protein
MKKLGDPNGRRKWSSQGKAKGRRSGQEWPGGAKVTADVQRIQKGSRESIKGEELREEQRARRREGFGETSR